MLIILTFRKADQFVRTVTLHTYRQTPQIVEQLTHFQNARPQHHLRITKSFQCYETDQLLKRFSVSFLL